MNNMELTGLAVEYQGDYGSASRNLNLADLMDESAGKCKPRIFGLGIEEQTSNSLLVEACTTFDNIPDALLIGVDAADPFK